MLMYSISDRPSADYAESSIQGYCTLWAAALTQAMADLQAAEFSMDEEGLPAHRAYSRAHVNRDIRRHRNSAEMWFNRKDDESVGSFRWVCDHLGLDADYIRSSVFECAKTRRQRRSSYGKFLPCKVKPNSKTVVALEYIQEHGTVDSDEEIARRLGISTYPIAQARRIMGISR